MARVWLLNNPVRGSFYHLIKLLELLGIVLDRLEWLVSEVRIVTVVIVCDANVHLTQVTEVCLNHVKSAALHTLSTN